MLANRWGGLISIGPYSEYKYIREGTCLNQREMTLALWVSG